ncbi:DUF3775 domain-containing protein [Polymorphobacter fuscus]|uniref:DUF3775 domain-containing protein n=1 Tax=Sandarakinorhabdus fusca TaxID=1439888 RepID=A0A7C9GSM9_9SPHN|nr:DUF3775 domain-containing protein [Polymorphobacter fuscus]KAB7648383.1 DUF3775 domain-containing protein [Polymorphobacter fuscus]MQT15898.1 DUF3775 domain-containing protein [Polymorphobacter fuscus]NJC07829.1 hypothetical protein [Polymorphobacter fuscus]
MELAVALENVCRIIQRAREYETLLPETDPDEGSNPTDDGEADAIEDDGDNPSEAELRAIVEDLAEDEQAEVIALALVGRGTFDASEWADALDAAAEEVDAIVEWMLEQPTLSTDLEAGLAAFDLSCDGVGTLV